MVTFGYREGDSAMSITVEVDWNALLTSFVSSCPLILFALIAFGLPLSVALLIAGVGPNPPHEEETGEFTEFRDALRR